MKNKITIEEINGKKYTVIWHQDSIATEKLNELLDNGEIKELETSQGAIIIASHNGYIATALPAILEHPTVNDASLIFLYAAHGLYLCGEQSAFKDDFNQELAVYSNMQFMQDWLPLQHIEDFTIKITYAIHAETGKQLEIAIK